MGTMNFQLPTDAPAQGWKDLERACVAGGFDSMPTPTRVQREGGILRITREIDESGCLQVPSPLRGQGQMIGSTATLVERVEPYQLSLELARGKLNQLRCQAAEWSAAGLNIPAEVDQAIREAGRLFGRAVLNRAAAEDDEAIAALDLSYRAAQQLMQVYVEQMFRARHQRQTRLDSALGVRLNGPIPPALADEIPQTFNTLALPLNWKSIEPTESQYRWETADSLLSWAVTKGLKLHSAPLIDFSTSGIPDWLWLWEGDLPSLSSFMCDYVETTVARYHRHVRRWYLTTASNVSGILKLSEDDLLWLTARLAEVAWQINPELELVIGIAQPWGDYMARAESTYSPFIFADMLLRAGLKMATLDLELVMGITPRGSYCRDRLEISRLIDQYAMLGTPLSVTLGYPSASSPDALADANLAIAAGHWRGGYSPLDQAAWTEDFASVLLCKPIVKSVHWCHLNDANVHQFPHCGLLDSAGKAKPALGRLRKLRSDHLR